MFLSWLSAMMVLFGGAFVLLMMCSSFLNLIFFKGMFFQSLFDLCMLYDMKGEFFLLGVSLIGLSVFAWSNYYMSSSPKLTLFYIILASFVGSMVLLLLSGSLLLVFLGWEGLGVTSFVLVVFYQNWMSAKGGLLTLLTNRVGDGLLIIVFSMWWSASFISMTLDSGVLLLVTVLLVAFTKSAQWPFMNWLPAAMAAPTPVSALVHSSTLVTAGVWLLIRLKQASMNTAVGFALFGMLTLLLASLAAFLESDAKKVVALSTLSQLGLMVFSLYLGNLVLCLFHVVMHALAKANLFLVVGNFLHSGLSQQDARKLSLGGTSKLMLVGLFISVSSLSGLIFSGGFYSKEQVMVQNYSSMNSTLSVVILVCLSSLTLGYCIKLTKGLTSMSNFIFSPLSVSGFSFTSVLILSLMSMWSGSFLANNMELSQLLLHSSMGYYWAILMISGITLLLVINLNLLAGFNLNNFMMDKVNSIMEGFKKGSSLMEANFSESTYLMLTLSTNKILELSGRSTFLVGGLLLLFLLF